MKFERDEGRCDHLIVTLTLNSADALLNTRVSFFSIRRCCFLRVYYIYIFMYVSSTYVDILYLYVNVIFKCMHL